MKTQENENLQRVVVLGVLLVSVIVLVVLPRGFEGSIYLLSVAAFSGIVAALIFITASVKQIKTIAEQMSNDYHINDINMNQPK